MKIRCEILTVGCAGDALTLTLQGREAKAAAWRSVRPITMSIPYNDSNCRAYYVGRIIDVTLKPRP